MMQFSINGAPPKPLKGADFTTPKFAAQMERVRGRIGRMPFVMASAPGMDRIGIVPQSVADPACVVLPLLSNTHPRIGNVVTCSQGTWINIVSSYSYQWQRDGSNIGGATTNSHTWGSGDTGHTLTCVVTAHGAHNVSVTSSNSAVEDAVAPVFTVAVALTGYTGAWAGTPDVFNFDNDIDGRDYAITIDFTRQGVAVKIALSPDGSWTGGGIFHHPIAVPGGDPADLLTAVVTYLGYGDAFGSNRLSIPDQYPSELGSLVIDDVYRGYPRDLPVTATLGGITSGPVLNASSGTIDGYPTPSAVNSWRLLNADGSFSTTVAGQTGLSIDPVALLIPHDGSKRLQFRRVATNTYGNATSDSSPSDPITPNP